MNSSDEDYATPERLAIYLEIGWSDFLFETPRVNVSDNGRPYPNPLCDRVPPNFPLAVATLARSWAKDISLDARSLCDVGGATGRTIFEFERQFSGLEQLVLVEPSGRFCEWARRLLSSDGKLPQVPLVDRVGSPRWVAPRTRPPPISRANERLTIVNETLERYQPQSGFDLITCLNVVDRHPCPSEVVDSIGRLMNDDGLLVLSCPFDFDQKSTPDVGVWIDDLNALFAGTSSWSHVGEDEVFYEFRSHNRSWTRFSAQVVGKRWHAKNQGAGIRKRDGA
jgi:SAM-dependent methyltransferase